MSEDNSIVASIKSHSWFTSGGKLPSGKIGQIYQSLYYMSLAEAKIKLLIFTDREAYEGFMKLCEGKLEDDIEIRLIGLSQELRSIMKTVQKNARKEMSYNRGTI